MIMIPEFYKHIPEQKDIKNDVLYISMEFEVAIHMCPCGCGNQNVMPFHTEASTEFRKQHGWGFQNDNGFITLSPSILSRICNAHYFLIRNEIKWC
jgi:hypothetical protein